MNVLVIAPHLPPTHIGGVEIYAKSIADQLAGTGHRVEAAAVEHVATGATDDCQSTNDVGFGYPVHRLTLTLRRGPAFPSLWHHVAADQWLGAAIKRFEPDVVHVHSGYLLGGAAMAASRRLGVPAVVSLHDYWFVCPRVTMLHPNGETCSGPEGVAKCAWCLVADKRRFKMVNREFGERMTRIAERSGLLRLSSFNERAEEIAARQMGLCDALHHAAAVLSPTRFVADQVSAIGFPRDRIRLSPYGVRSLPPGRRLSGHDGLRLAYLGQIAPHKGVHVAIEAVRANPDPRLALSIFGPLTVHQEYVARLQQLAAGDARISFHGAYQRDALPAILAAADALVVPSIWYENAPIVIQEAQGAAVPVIASRIGGIPELVAHNQNGVLFEPGDSYDLGRQIARLQSEPGLLTRLRSRTHSPRTLDDDVQALVSLYASVCHRP